MSISPNHLRLHIGDTSTPDICESDFPGLTSLRESFQAVTGWQLNLTYGGPDSGSNVLWEAPVKDTLNDLVASLRVESDATRIVRKSKKLENAVNWCDGLARILTELQETRHALWQREAELAASVPVVARGSNVDHLASQLQAVLRGGVESTNCQAAAAYLLDDATTELKLRAQWGLPQLRFVQPARPLRGAIADLEALTGHAVVIEDTATLPHWNVPEEFSSAVCVPISTPTVILGTLWMFCDRVRDFSSAETNLIEIVAGRLAADLERNVLLHETSNVKQIHQELDDVLLWQQERQSRVNPVLDGWEVAGQRTTFARADTASDEVATDFFRWQLQDNDHMSVAVGGVPGRGMVAALTSTSLQSMVDCHMSYEAQPKHLLLKTNQALWSNSPGDQLASLFYGQISSHTGALTFATAGATDAYILRPHGWEPLSQDKLMLGTKPDARYRQELQHIAAGDVLLIISDRGADSCDESQVPTVDTAAVAEALLRRMHLPAREMAELAAELVGPVRRDNAQANRSVVVIKRAEQ